MNGIFLIEPNHGHKFSLEIVSLLRLDHTDLERLTWIWAKITVWEIDTTLQTKDKSLIITFHQMVFLC